MCEGGSRASADAHQGATPHIFRRGRKMIKNIWTHEERPQKDEIP